MVRYDFVSCAKYIKDHKLQWLLELLLLLNSVVNSTQCNMQCTTKWVIINIAFVTIISFSIISKFQSTFNKICSKIKATQKLRSSWETLNLEFRPNCDSYKHHVYLIRDVISINKTTFFSQTYIIIKAIILWDSFLSFSTQQSNKVNSTASYNKMLRDKGRNARIVENPL